MATPIDKNLANFEQIGEVSTAQDGVTLAYVTNRWSLHVIQPILIACLSTSLLTAIVVLIQFVLTGEPLLRVVPLLFIITLEGVYTNRWLSQPHQRTLNRTGYRAAELMFIFVFVRLFTWIAFGNWPSYLLFLDYLKSPGLLLIDGHFVFTIVMTLIAWGLGIGYANLFAEISISEVEAIHFLTPKKYRNEDHKPFQLNRTGLVQVFFTQWAVGGFILILLTAMTSLDLPNAVETFSLNVTRLEIHPGLFWALVLYFISGFLLLSQGKLTAQTARWLRAGTTKGIDVEQSWYRNSFRLVLIVAGVTAFIPIGSTTPISRLLGGLLRFITAIFVALLALLGKLLASLFPSGGEQTEVVPPPATIPPIEPFPTPVFEEPPPPNEVIQYVFSSALWAILIVASVLALSFFIRERGIKFNLATLKMYWQRLIVLIKAGFVRMSDQVEAIQHALSRQSDGDRAGDDNGRTNLFQYIRVNGLPPKEQIKYFYLSTLRRMEDKGLERGRGMTPTEFVKNLKEAFPEAEEEVETLTDAFLQARYSKKEFEDEDINPVKARWKKMRQNIRRKRSL